MSARKSTLSPRDLAQVVGVSESSLKRWADDGLLRISRTAGGHRRIELAEAASYIRRSGLPLDDPAPLGLPDLTTLVDGVAPERLDYLLVDAIQRGDRASACGLTLKLYLSGRSVCEICDGPMKHALRHDPIALIAGPPASSDRLEVEICLAALDQLIDLLPPPRGPSTALLVTDTSPANAIAARMMQTVLAAERWQRFSSDISAMLETARDQQAQMIAMPAGLLNTSNMFFEETARAVEAISCRLVLVGFRNAHPACVSVVDSMSEFASLVRCIEAINAGTLHQA